MSVIHVAGNYGSGKSHAIKCLINQASKVEHGEKIKGFYSGHLLDDKVFVVGDYITDFGWTGPDVIGYDMAFALVPRWYGWGYNVIVETLMNTDYLPAWKRDVGAKVCLIKTPLEDCLRAVREKGTLGDQYLPKARRHHETIKRFRKEMQLLGIEIGDAVRSNACRVLKSMI